LEANLRKLEEQKQRLEEQGADPTEINQPQAEQEKQAWTNQNATHLANVDKCKRVLEWLPATSEPVSEEIIREDSEFFTQLESETDLGNTRQQLDNLKTELTKKEQEWQELEQKLSGEQTKSGELEGQLTALAISSGLLSQQ
ncbi:474_t:CDS:2, partial [Cetraspora pellucida]